MSILSLIIPPFYVGPLYFWFCFCFILNRCYPAAFHSVWFFFHMVLLLLLLQAAYVCIDACCVVWEMPLPYIFTRYKVCKQLNKIPGRKFLNSQIGTSHLFTSNEKWIQSSRCGYNEQKRANVCLFACLFVYVFLCVLVFSSYFHAFSSWMIQTMPSKGNFDTIHTVNRSASIPLVVDKRKIVYIECRSLLVLCVNLRTSKIMIIFVIFIKKLQKAEHKLWFCSFCLQVKIFMRHT